MPYERDYKRAMKIYPYCVIGIPRLTSDLSCDGCGERCRFSIKLDIQDCGFHPRKGNQKFVINPVVYAGDVKLYDCGVSARVGHYPNEITVDFDNFRAETLYRNALAWCRETCKHSKMR